jgi:hypothetical protein
MVQGIVAKTAPKAGSWKPASPSAVEAAASTLLLDIDNHAEFSGFCLSVRDVKTFRRQSTAQQLANRRSPAGHVTTESPLIQGDKLIHRKHDLKTFAARLGRHGALLSQKSTIAQIAPLTHNKEFLSSA